MMTFGECPRRVRSCVKGPILSKGTAFGTFEAFCNPFPRPSEGLEGKRNSWGSEWLGCRKALSVNTILDSLPLSLSNANLQKPNRPNKCLGHGSTKWRGKTVRCFPIGIKAEVVDKAREQILSRHAIKRCRFVPLRNSHLKRATLTPKSCPAGLTQLTNRGIKA